MATKKKNTDSDQNSKLKVLTAPVLVAIIYESISIYRSDIGRQYNQLIIVIYNTLI